MSLAPRAPGLAVGGVWTPTSQTHGRVSGGASLRGRTYSRKAPALSATPLSPSRSGPEIRSASSSRSDTPMDLLSSLGVAVSTDEWKVALTADPNALSWLATKTNITSPYSPMVGYNPEKGFYNQTIYWEDTPVHYALREGRTKLVLLEALGDLGGDYSRIGQELWRSSNRGVGANCQTKRPLYNDQLVRVYDSLFGRRWDSQIYSRLSEKVRPYSNRVPVFQVKSDGVLQIPYSSTLSEGRVVSNYFSELGDIFKVHFFPIEEASETLAPHLY